MNRHKFVMDLRPGDRVHEDDEFYNAHRSITRTQRTDGFAEPTRWTVWFADGSIIETTNGARRVRMEA